MAGLSNEEFQDTDQEDFEYIERHPEPNRLLQRYENLQCELEMEYEVLTVAELFEDNKSEEKKKQDKRLDEIKGTCWSNYANNIIEYTRNGGKYNILTQLLDYGLGRTKTCDTNRKMAQSFRFVKCCGIGMINYKRLGYAPDEKVNWIEINLALVEATALLCILSDKIEVRFKNYFPVPHDSKPFIIVLSDQRILPLYGEGEFKKFKSKEFDDALVAFLDCLKQLNAGIKKTTTQQNIPHEIENDKLLDPETGRQYTVRLQESTNHKHWSRAMMFLLINMEWLSKWVTLFLHKFDVLPPLPTNLGSLLKTTYGRPPFSDDGRN